MSSPIPVPSKAAIAALRGLVVGTSCTLVLVTEDRRRRINAARSAISNAEKLRSAKQYHSGGTAFALAPPDEELSDAGLIRWKNQDGSDASTHRRAAWMEVSPEAFLSGSQSMRRTRAAAPEPKTNEHRSEPSPSSIPAPPARAPVTPPTFINSIHQKNVGDSLATMEHRKTHRNQTQLGPAPENDISALVDTNNHINTQLVDETIGVLSVRLSSDTISEDDRRELLKSAARLARSCQDAGFLLQAQQILGIAIEHGPLPEEAYHEFEPLNLVRYVLKTVEAAQPSDRPGALLRLKSAIHLFLPTFTDKPHIFAEDVMSIGKQLIQRALELNDVRLVDDVFWRVTSYFDCPVEFTEWFISALHESGQHKRAIKFYLLCYSKMQPDEVSYNAVGDIVVKAVNATHGFKARRVIAAMMQSRPEAMKLKTNWVTNLLYCHWQRQQSYEETAQMFKQLVGVDTDLQPIVMHLDALYRVMMQISIEAGEDTMANEYFAHLTSKHPAASTNPRIVGLLALMKAKQGDWSGVRKDFETMDTIEGSDQVFVPILKEYTKTHTIKETEQFLRTFLEELHVPLCDYMVTLIAKEYGAAQDVQSFINWLDYCTNANFKADAALSRAILVNCRRWNFGYDVMQNIYSSLKQLDPNLTDEFADRVMLQTAYSGVKYKYGTNTPQKRVRALNIKPMSRTARGRSTDQGSVYIAMKQALVHGNPRTAAKIFTRATRHGMPYCERCLKLAIQGLVAAGHGNIQPAIDLLRKYQQAGHDISVAALPVFASQLDKINVRSGRELVRKEVTKVLEHFEAGDIKLGHSALTRAAMVCLQAKHYTGAISFGLAALNDKGENYPCTPSSFFVLLSAYVGIADPKGVEWAVHGALDNQLGRSKACMRTLRLARAQLKSSIQTSDVKQSLAAVREGISKCQSLRERFETDKKALETETMRIMQKAAEDSAASVKSITRSGDGAQPREPTKLHQGYATKREDSPAHGHLDVLRAESFNRPIAVGGAGY